MVVGLAIVCPPAGLAAVTSKTGQKVIRGTASIIDNVKRPVYIKSMEVIGGIQYQLPLPVKLLEELGLIKNIL